MELTLRTGPTIQGDHSFGSAEKTLNYDSKLKLQITGPEADMILFEGPPEGKKWKLILNVFIKETDV